MFNSKNFFAAAFLLLATSAFGQSVQQSGTVTRNHVPYWVTSGVIGDGGSSADSPISSLGVTNNGGAGICVNSARVTAAGYQALCFGAATAGAATISLQNFGTAVAQSLNFVINGTTYPFPGSLANITIGTTAVVGGTTGQCLYVSGVVVGQQNCTLAAITSLTGDVTGSGPGITATTLATVNATPGTFGSGSVVPVVTVNAKGLITSITTTPFGITVGSSSIALGTNNGLLYDNGGLLGNLSSPGNGVLITNGSGVPSIANVLPSGLTLPSPTFTGTLTLPDAATWTNVGISKVVALSAGSATIPSSGNINVSGQYQVSGAQIAASNLSDGKTGTGALVGAASPAISGTWTGSATFSGALTFSGVANFTSTFQIGGNAMTFPGAAATLSQTIASGATALGTGAITSGTCATVITATATNTATTDVLLAGFNGDPTAVTGYIPTTNGMLTIVGYPTTNTANFKVCNNTSASVTPGAITLNWRVVR
jgi:hypothetical protein